MKKTASIFAAFVLLLCFLAGCGREAEPETKILVSIREGKGFTVENNGQYIEPGEDAVFLLRMESDVALAATDYEDSDYKVLPDGRVELTVKAVRYPTRVALELTNTFALICYDDTLGRRITLPHDTSLRSRPNTANGVGLFAREGYILESWNTRPDGSGDRIGLGSRVTVPAEGLTLYAQWAKWSDETDFDWSVTEDGAAVTGYRGEDSIVVVPASYQGKPVTAVASGAFQNCKMTGVILPNSMVTVDEGAFDRCSLETLTLFDNIESIKDKSFRNCRNFSTLRINAVEKPYGTIYRRESCYADKVDLLLNARGRKKIVFYGGCSIWYNLDSTQLAPLVELGYQPVNMGLNGLSSSTLQLQILGHFLEDGDILFHTPELTSTTQMMLQQQLTIDDDDKLWCGLEYNYDLVTLLDVRTLPGLLDTFSGYLGMKKGGTSYATVYTKDGHTYCDEYGTIPFYRGEQTDYSPNKAYLDFSYVDREAMGLLQSYYDKFQSKGVRVYVSYACLDIDEVPEEQRDNVDGMDQRFRDAITAMNGPAVISHLYDYIYHNSDFYDSNYHMLSESARVNTRTWMRDLKAQMILDGLWEEQ